MYFYLPNISAPVSTPAVCRCLMQFLFTIFLLVSTLLSLSDVVFIYYISARFYPAVCRCLMQFLFTIFLLVSTLLSLSDVVFIYYISTRFYPAVCRCRDAVFSCYYISTCFYPAVVV